MPTQAWLGIKDYKPLGDPYQHGRVQTIHIILAF
jgi:hypothetical protein